MSLEHINIRQIMEYAVKESGIVIDVRPVEKFQMGHIPMAVNIPLYQIQQGRVTLPKSKKLIVYCESGGTSMLAARLLERMGYDVINCVGGLNHYGGSLAK